MVPVSSPPTPPAELLRFREVYDAHFSFVWRTLCRFGVREADLPDAAQEVFMVVHRRLADFEGRSQLTTWLFRICLRVARGRVRRASARYEVLAGNEAAEGQPALDTFDPVERSDARALLERALASMTLDQRAVFSLCEFEGLTGDEVAEVLEISLGTVYSRLRRARELFQRSLRTAAPLRQPPLSAAREGA